MDGNNNSSACSTSAAVEGSDLNADGEGNNVHLEGGLDEVQMHLTCLPERYMRAKFTLSAYLLCWTVLKLCQRLRVSPAVPQILYFFRKLMEARGLCVGLWYSYRETRAISVILFLTPG
ncbi:hypothetical protein AAFF_G00229390 [Aldrovandia affinis]|uniref:Uncharacterized protein n=1 Tax=Aldrovandia affinis TaxID=143900 RepID=A0AAD7SVQ8_9TELE|nr:hypothetical protein AAFF_G00229390 [Aldrovandia affinis]